MFIRVIYELEQFEHVPLKMFVEVMDFKEVGIEFALLTKYEIEHLKRLESTLCIQPT